MALKYTEMELARPVTLIGLWTTIKSAVSIQQTHSQQILKTLTCDCVTEWQPLQAKIL